MNRTFFGFKAFESENAFENSPLLSIPLVGWNWVAFFCLCVYPSAPKSRCAEEFVPRSLRKSNIQLLSTTRLPIQSPITMCVCVCVSLGVRHVGLQPPPPAR